jgi:protein involved in polysaccharide export with SLBB domain
MGTTRSTIVLAMWLLLLAVASASAQEAGTDYALAAGDRIKVTVYGHDDLSGEFQVDENGDVVLPLIRNVPALKRTARELEQAITASLEPRYLRNPRVSVEVLTLRPFYILGEVTSPGSYEYTAGMTVIKAAALAGGFTYRANTKKVKVTREGSSEPIERAPLQSEVGPGDVIEVPERFF